MFLGCLFCLKNLSPAMTTYNKHWLSIYMISRDHSIEVARDLDIINKMDNIDKLKTYYLKKLLNRKNDYVSLESILNT